MGQRYSTVGLAFTLNIVNLGWIPGAVYDPIYTLSTESRIFPEH